MIMPCIIGFHVDESPKTPAWQQHGQQLISKFSSAIEATGAVGTFCSKDFRNSLRSALFWGMWMCNVAMCHAMTCEDNIDVERYKIMDHDTSLMPQEKDARMGGDLLLRHLRIRGLRLRTSYVPSKRFAWCMSKPQYLGISSQNLLLPDAYQIIRPSKNYSIPMSPL